MKGHLVGRMGTCVDGENREQHPHVPELQHARGVAGSNAVPLPEMETESRPCFCPLPAAKPLAQGSHTQPLELNKEIKKSLCVRLSQPLVSFAGLNSNGDNVTSKETSSGEPGSTKEKNVILNSDTSVP